jgi:predicted transport protein
MPLFKVNDNKVQKLNINTFSKERELQRLFEANLEELLDVRFIATEFSIGEKYGGRMDTLGIDGNGNPTIIEYKLSQNENVINQALFYLDWLVDHKGDFEKVAKDKLGNDLVINWNSPKVIIIAQSYNKYDKYAVNRMGVNINLYRYLLYGEDMLYLESVNQLQQECSTKLVLSKASNTNAEDTEVAFQALYDKTTKEFVEILKELKERILQIDDSISERITKIYVAYATTRNFAEIQCQKSSLVVYLMTKEYDDPENKVEIVPASYNYSLNRRLKINSYDDIEYAFSIIKQSYESTL